MSLVDEFFEINAAPSDFDEVMRSVADFIRDHPGKRIAVVTVCPPFSFPSSDVSWFLLLAQSFVSF